MQFSGGPKSVRQNLRIGYLGIDEGREGIRQTMLLMRDIARRYKSDPTIVLKARELTAGLGAKNYYGEIRALHQFVRDSIRYVKDPLGVETIITPDKLLQIGQGDCDDKATLLASLLESIGHPARYVAVGFSPGDYSHVFVQTRAGAGWLNLETTEPVAPGWGPRDVQAAMTVDV